MPSYLHQNQAPPKGQQFQNKTYHANSPATQEHSPELQYTGSSKLFQNLWCLITHYWSVHCTPERNPVPPTRTPTQASLTKKSWQAIDTTPPTVRKLHNKENSTNSQNIEWPPQTQQYNQDEETEEYSAGKGTGEMPTKPNKRGRDRNLPEKEFQILIVKMIQNLEIKMES